MSTNELDKNAQEHLEILQGYICEFQILHPNYQIALSEKHKKLRKYVDRLGTRNTPSKSDSVGKLLSEFLDLVDDYILASDSVASAGINKYFSKIGRAEGHMPRVCIKGLEKEEVVDSYRSNVPYNYRALICENSAFEKIVGGLNQYHEPNIPLAVQNGGRGYKNKRLDKDLAQNYKIPNENELAAIAANGYFDLEWKNRWFDRDEGRIADDAFYKSTLVTPMTNRAGIKRFEKETKTKLLKGPEGDDNRKLLYGFFCLDHVKPGFFNTTTDQSMAWIYADLISLAFIAIQSLTTLSDVFDKAVKYLEQYPSEKYPIENTSFSNNTSYNSMSDKGEAREVANNGVIINNNGPAYFQVGDNNTQRVLSLNAEQSSSIMDDLNELGKILEEGDRDDKAILLQSEIVNEIATGSAEKSKIMNKLDMLSNHLKSYLNISDKAVGIVERIQDVLSAGAG